MNYDIQTYSIILNHLDVARKKIDALIDEMREELSDIESEEHPSQNNVKAATLTGEKIINHVLASKYISEAYGALGFYKAVLEGLADETDEEYDPEDVPDTEMTDEELELFESDINPDELPQTFELDDDEEYDVKSDGPTCECDLPDDDVVFVHDFTKRETIH